MLKIEKLQIGAVAAAVMTMGAAVEEGSGAPRFRYDCECIGPREDVRDEYIRLRDEMLAFEQAGDAIQAIRLRALMTPMEEVKWVDGFENLVTTLGKTDTAAWYLGLKGTGTAVVGDTAASHGGWSEVNPYTGNRPAITFGTTSGGSNTATAVAYTITGTATVAGAFVQSVNTGTTGTLYSAGDFAASRSVLSGDTLNVTLTVSAT
jgi:hypothetical protein